MASDIDNRVLFLSLWLVFWDRRLWILHHQGEVYPRQWSGIHGTQLLWRGLWFRRTPWTGNVFFSNLILLLRFASYNAFLIQTYILLLSTGAYSQTKHAFHLGSPHFKLYFLACHIYIFWNFLPFFRTLYLIWNLDYFVFYRLLNTRIWIVF